MCKGLLLKVLLFFIVVSGRAFAGLKDYPTIAVLPFSHHAPAISGSSEAELSLKDAKIASDYVMDNLVDCGEFQVIDREQMEAIYSEHNLNLSGTVDPSTAQKIGKLTGVKYLVYGSIVGCSLKENEVGYSNETVGTGASNKQHVVIANLLGRFIDVETGRIVLTGRGRGSSTSTHSELKFLKGNNNTTTSTDYSDEETATDTTTTGTTHVIKFGTATASQVQVHNAIAKAAYDLVGGKMGFLAKLDGATKWKVKYKKPKGK